MIVRNMIFEAEIIEQRRFPSFQTSHHGAFLPRLFLRGNHRRQIKTTIFSASASALCTDVVLFCNGTFSPTFKIFAHCGLPLSQADNPLGHDPPDHHIMTELYLKPYSNGLAA